MYRSLSCIIKYTKKIVTLGLSWSLQHIHDRLADTASCTKGLNIENKYLQFCLCNSSDWDIFHILEPLQSPHIIFVSFSRDDKWIRKSYLGTRNMFHGENRRYEILRHD